MDKMKLETQTTMDFVLGTLQDPKWILESSRYTSGYLNFGDHGETETMELNVKLARRTKNG